MLSRFSISNQKLSVKLKLLTPNTSIPMFWCFKLLFNLIFFCLRFQPVQNIDLLQVSNFSFNFFFLSKCTHEIWLKAESQHLYMYTCIHNGTMEHCQNTCQQIKSIHKSAYEQERHLTTLYTICVLFFWAVSNTLQIAFTSVVLQANIHSIVCECFEGHNRFRGFGDLIVWTIRCSRLRWWYYIKIPLIVHHLLYYFYIEEDGWTIAIILVVCRKYDAWMQTLYNNDVLLREKFPSNEIFTTNIISL